MGLWDDCDEFSDVCEIIFAGLRCGDCGGLVPWENDLAEDSESSNASDKDYKTSFAFIKLKIKYIL